MDYRSDPALTESVTFGVRVDGEWWHIEADPATGTGSPRVSLNEGTPSEPTFFFFMDSATLTKLDRGELNARTAMGRARHSDPVPMDIDPTDEGFVWTDSVSQQVDAVANHFFVRGQPEIVSFNRNASRVIHGAHAVLLYYYPGLRSVWYQVAPGQHINKEERDQSNPFPSLFIFLEGRGMARIGGVETEVVGGTSMLVRPGVRHEFWNPFGQPVEFILIMFGEGA
jgi:mannose-6-phosphate isomerase-like protein (cupin superfamily)